MPTNADPAAAAQAALAGLTGPGGDFELVPTDVLGARIPAYRNCRGALHELLADSVDYGDDVYIATARRTLTFAEHAARVSSLAEALREQYDVRPGDRVAIAAANVPEWIESFWAVTSLGAVAVGFNAWWSPAELAYGLGHARPAVVIADAKRIEALGDIAMPLLSVEQDVPRLAGLHPEAPLPSGAVDPDDPAVMLYTSGTSGRPKGVLHSHRNLCSAVMFHAMNDALLASLGDPTPARDRVYLLVMPLFHIGSLHNLAVPRLANGTRIALHEGAFDVDEVLALIDRERVTNWGAVPTMASRMLAEGDFGKHDTSSLTAFALASAPSSPSFKQRLREGLPFSTSLTDSYGLTETCTAVSVATPADLAASPGTLGRPVHGVELQVRDPHGNEVGPGVEGEVCVRSVYNMIGYWEDDEATAQAIRVDRWLHTGDLGTLDEEGRLRLSSRRSDLIIRGGENVYPAEVEAVLAEHPEVAECLVLGVPDDDLGERVAAVVVPSAASEEGGLADRLATYAGERLAGFKVPVRWQLRTEPLPRNATGKVIRTQVRI